MGFGIVFDIDGVLIRGKHPIPGAVTVLSELQSKSIPFVYVTNSGGVPDKAKAELLTGILEGFTIEPERLIAAHTPFKKLAEGYRDLRVLLVGQNREHMIQLAEEFGLRKVVLLEDYAQQRPFLYPSKCYEPLEGKEEEDAERIHAIMVLKAPADWGEALQVIIDVVLANGNIPQKCVLPQNEKERTTTKEEEEEEEEEEVVPIFIANPDVVYQSEYPISRMTVGAFGLCLQTLYKQYEPMKELKIQYFGKPFKLTYEYAEELLQSQAVATNTTIETIYAIGDNPRSDIQGANAMGGKWFSILTRSGVFRDAEEKNDPQYPAHFVADDVLKAFQFIQLREDSFAEEESKSQTAESI